MTPPLTRADTMLADQPIGYGTARFVPLNTYSPPVNAPRPNEQDRAQAEAFVVEHYDNDPTISRTWLANNREDYVDAFARMFAQDRIMAEYRARRAKLEEAA